jgi:hypothetical protein
MKYETPRVVLLTPALDAIQTKPGSGEEPPGFDNVAAYEDWE